MTEKVADFVPLTLRLQEPMRMELERAARGHGISMNAEILTRLRKSFEDELKVDKVLDNRVAIGVAKLLTAVMSEVGRIAGFNATHTVQGSIDWFANPWAFNMAARGANVALDLLRPEGKIEEAIAWPPGMDKAGRAQAHQALAEEVLRLLVHGQLRSGERGDRLEGIRNDLGDLYVRLRSRLDQTKSVSATMARPKVRK